MATNLDELSLSLNQGAQASGNLAGLDERYERANALRDQPIQEMKGNATGTGLSAIANLMNSYTGNKRAAAIEPQRAAAREQMAGAKNALPMYNAQRAEEATALAATNRTEDQQNKKEAALLLATAKADAMNTPVTYVSRIDGGEEITGYPTEGGGVVDNKGNLLDVSNKVPYKTWMDQQSKIATQANTTAVRERIEQGKWARSSEKDPYGNTLTTLYNTTTEERKPATFSDGVVATPEEQIKRGDIILAQKKQAGLNTIQDKADAKAVARSDEKSDTMSLSINEIDKALAALTGSDGNTPADTGWFSNMLPNVRANAIKIQQARDQLALYEIGKYSFGALSQAEGTWLKDVTIPLNMNEDELEPFLRKKREGLRRYQQVESMIQEMRALGITPTREEKDAILYAGGFTFD